MKTPRQQAQELHDALKSDETNVEALLRLTEFMGQYDGDDRIVSSDDLEAEITEFENEERYTTGIKKLDAITGGFRSNQLIVISAPPKAGKTQFCVHLAKSLPNPTMFLFEETAPEVLYKYKKKGLPLPKFYTTNELVEMNIESLYRKMIEAWAKYNSRIFFVDHLHFLLDGKENAGFEIKEIVQSLKKFAKRHKFTIFLIAHISKGYFDEPPGVEAIRDSSFIPQYADTVIMLWREAFRPNEAHKGVLEYTNNVLLNVALNRKINFDADRNTGLCDLTFDVDKWAYSEDTEWYTEWTREGQEYKDERKKINSLIVRTHG